MVRQKEFPITEIMICAVPISFDLSTHMYNAAMGSGRRCDNCFAHIALA